MTDLVRNPWSRRSRRTVYEIAWIARAPRRGRPARRVRWDGLGMIAGGLIDDSVPRVALLRLPLLRRA
jgi:hypothetical protein